MIGFSFRYVNNNPICFYLGGTPMMVMCVYANKLSLFHILKKKKLKQSATTATLLLALSNNT
jgi:glutaredoxin-related protein